MEDYYKILGLKLGTTLDEVEEKYNELLKEFDPKEQSDSDLKEFFKSEQDKVKEAYKEISQSLINTESVEEKIDEINSEKNVLESTKKKKKSEPKKSVKKKKVKKKAVDKSPVKKSINKPHKKKGNKFSISSEIELTLSRAYLIMFILGFPLIFLISGEDLGDMFLVYYDFMPGAVITHLIGAILVLLCHMFLIIKSSGFLSIRENLSAYFIERKKYFIRIIAFTPLVLLSLYGWSGMINNSENSDYWYNSYKEITSEVSGDDYDSGCNQRKMIKFHNHTNQNLRFYHSHKLRNGVWTKWGYSTVYSKYYTRYGVNDFDGYKIYTSDYRYYITTTSGKKYMYSRNAPHVTNICNAKCINIY